MSERIRRLEGRHDLLAAAAIRLLEQSFPPEEREPSDQLIEELDDGDARWWVAEGEDNALLGFLRGWLVGRAGFVIHVAVIPEQRGSGLGRRLIETAHAAFAAETPDYQGAFFEVERPQDAADDLDRTARLKRQAFFARLGALRLTGAYTQPPMAAGKPSVPLDLLFLSACPDPDSEQLIIDFYREAFNLEPHHPFVQRALAGAEKPPAPLA